jgi:hypothetical protein
VNRSLGFSGVGIHLVEDDGASILDSGVCHDHAQSGFVCTIRGTATPRCMVSGLSYAQLCWAHGLKRAPLLGGQQIEHSLETVVLLCLGGTSLLAESLQASHVSGVG